MAPKYIKNSLKFLNKKVTSRVMSWEDRHCLCATCKKLNEENLWLTVKSWNIYCWEPKKNQTSAILSNLHFNCTQTFLLNCRDEYLIFGRRFVSVVFSIIYVWQPIPKIWYPTHLSPYLPVLERTIERARWLALFRANHWARRWLALRYVHSSGT